MWAGNKRLKTTGTASSDPRPETTKKKRFAGEKQVRRRHLEREEKKTRRERDKSLQASPNGSAVYNIVLKKTGRRRLGEDFQSWRGPFRPKRKLEKKGAYSRLAACKIL